MISTRSRPGSKRPRLEEAVDRFTRKRAPSGFPLTLSRKGTYILPTAQGLLFMFILFVMLIGSINYNNNLGFFFTFLLTGMTFLSMIQTHRNLSGLTVNAEGLRPVFAGDSAVMAVAIEPGNLERIGIHLGFEGGESRRISLTAGRPGRVNVSFTAKTRGQFRVKALTFSSTFPLGLFRTWSTVYPELEYLVYPRPLAGPFDVGFGTGGSEGKGISRAIGTDDFKELRAYRPGDPLSRLSWKQFSRGQGLVTKEFAALSGEALLLSWDNMPHEPPEKKLSRLCDLIINAQRVGLRFGLSIPGTEIPPGDSKDAGHVHQCLKALALFPGAWSEGRAK